LRPVKKTVNKKVGPGENISPELLKDKAVGDYLRILLGHDNGTAIEMIVHHPIGVHDLSDDDWVISSPEEVTQLKLRSKDPNYSSLMAQRTKYLRDEAVAAKLIEIGDKGAVVYPSKEDRGKFLESLKKKHTKSNEADKNYKFILDLALEKEDSKDPNIQAEKAYRQWLKANQKKAEEKFPQNFRTTKGPLADQPQSAIHWLKGLKVAEVGSSLMKHGTIGPVEGSEHGSDPDDMTTISTTGAMNQWFFYSSNDKSKKKEVRELADKIRKLIGTPVKIIIDEPN
jgi:hypothetical protein